MVLRTRIEVENMILPFFSLGNFTDNLMHRTKAVAMAQERKRNEASYQKHSGWVSGHANVCFITIHSKFSSVLPVCLLQIFMKQTLFGQFLA